jgi:L-ascorbate metabolism protein UlaG (beta-lactamase superfamily)
VKHNRRKFLGYSALLGATASGAWLGFSQGRAARWLRRIIADSGRGVLPAPVRPEPGKWSDNAVSICWIGHATVLINFYGIRILTDPTLGDRCGVDLGIGTVGPKRYIAPALRLKELPPIDLVLLSHAHMDHLDLASLSPFIGKTPIVAAKNTSDLISDGKSKPPTELKWGENFTLQTDRGELQLEAFQVNHWGQRWPSEKIGRGYNGYILRREGRAVLFGGDTANTSLFGEVRSRRPFDVAIMPIGAYQPWIRYHCTPEQAVEMANAARADYVVPIHHQTFKLSDEPMNEPIERIQSALQREPERLALKRIGEKFVLPKA